MAEKETQEAHGAEAGAFVITKDYIREQAAEAIMTFVAPVSGAAKAFQKAGRPAEKKTPTEV